MKILLTIFDFTLGKLIKLIIKFLSFIKKSKVKSIKNKLIRGEIKVHQLNDLSLLIALAWDFYNEENMDVSKDIAKKSLKIITSDNIENSHSNELLEIYSIMGLIEIKEEQIESSIFYFNKVKHIPFIVLPYSNLKILPQELLNVGKINLIKKYLTKSLKVYKSMSSLNKEIFKTDRNDISRFINEINDGKIPEIY